MSKSPDSKKICVTSPKAQQQEPKNTFYDLLDQILEKDLPVAVRTKIIKQVLVDIFADEINLPEIPNQFLTGVLPLGSPKATLWDKIPTNANADKIRLDKIENHISTKKREIEELKQKIQTFTQNLRALEKEKDGMLLNPLISFFKKLDPDQTSLFQQIIQKRAAIESQLVQQIQTQAMKDVTGFSAFNPQICESVSLSCIFNILGISQPTIRKLLDLDAENFLFDQVSSLCASFNIQDFRDIKALEYCHSMLSRKKIPFDGHDDCTVCAANSPQKLYELLKSRDFDFDPSVLIEKNIDGRRFLAINANDLKNEFKITDIELCKVFRFAVLELRKLHGGW